MSRPCRLTSLSRGRDYFVPKSWRPVLLCTGNEIYAASNPKLAFTHTFALDCNTPIIPGRNASLNSLLHVILDGGTARWLRRYRSKVSNLRISGIGLAR